MNRCPRAAQVRADGAGFACIGFAHDARFLSNTEATTLGLREDFDLEPLAVACERDPLLDVPIMVCSCQPRTE